MEKKKQRDRHSSNHMLRVSARVRAGMLQASRRRGRPMAQLAEMVLLAWLRQQGIETDGKEQG